MRGLLLFIAFFAFAVSACSSLRTPCEQTCYSQKTNEPRDFDDCIKRCQR